MRQYLVHVREVPNGYDFIFNGSTSELHNILHQFIKDESEASKPLDFIHAQVQESFILRVTGPVDMKSQIKDYFEAER